MQPNHTAQKSISFLRFESVADQLHWMLPSLLLENTATLIPQVSPCLRVTDLQHISVTAAPLQLEELYCSSEIILCFNHACCSCPHLLQSERLTTSF